MYRVQGGKDSICKRKLSQGLLEKSYMSAWDGLYPNMLDDVIARLLSIFSEKLWRSGEVHNDWRKAYLTPTPKKGKEDSLGNYRLNSQHCFNRKENHSANSLGSHL